MAKAKRGVQRPTKKSEYVLRHQPCSPGASHSPVTRSRGLAIADELFELFDREADASADADRHELFVPDELVDRRSAESENLGGFHDVDEQRARGRPVGLVVVGAGVVVTLT
ncbi:MAG: hypothetical protein ACI9N0_002795 [Ilumatobacter sp.]|jgi:hypothetical protein